MLIQFFGGYAVFIWTIMPTFRKNMLPAIIRLLAQCLNQLRYREPWKFMQEVVEFMADGVDRERKRVHRFVRRLPGFAS
jgi:hypothetical protein